MKNFLHKEGTRSVLASLISILIGLVAGSILILVVGLTTKGLGLKSAWEGIQLVFFGLFSTGRNASGALTFGFNPSIVGNMLFRATPVILTGLSVAVAFKTGLFNIGAPGQYLAGTTVTLLIALSIPTGVGDLAAYQAAQGIVPAVTYPTWFVWTLAFLGGLLAGALWGAIPGLLKSLLNINEVIACIMTNWIAANLATWVFDVSNLKNVIENTKTSYIYKTTVNGVATSKMGLDQLFPAQGLRLQPLRGPLCRYQGQAEHRAVDGHRRFAGGRGGFAVLSQRQHRVFLVHLSAAARRGLQRHSGSAAGFQPSHRRDLRGHVHVHAGYRRSAADQSDRVQRVHHGRYHCRDRLSGRVLAGHPHVAVRQRQAPPSPGGKNHPCDSGNQQQ